MFIPSLIETGKLTQIYEFYTERPEKHRAIATSSKVNQ